MSYDLNNGASFKLGKRREKEYIEVSVVVPTKNDAQLLSYLHCLSVHYLTYLFRVR